jgi:hypothetical protein
MVGSSPISWSASRPLRGSSRMMLIWAAYREHQAKLGLASI